MNGNMVKELIYAQFKAGDHNSILGVLWSLLGPVLLTVVMYFIFIERFGRYLEAYPLYILIGVTCVSFFSISTSYIIKIFKFERDIVLNSTVPRENILFSVLFFHAYKFFIELLLCLLISLVLGRLPLGTMALIVPLFIAFVALTMGISLILSLSYCFSRDIEHIWMIVSRLFLIITPVFYSLKGISLWARKIIYVFNPLTPFVISFRGLLMGKGEAFHWGIYAHSLLLGTGVFCLGYFLFLQFENAALERS